MTDGNDAIAGLAGGTDREDPLSRGETTVLAASAVAARTAVDGAFAAIDVLDVLSRSPLPLGTATTYSFLDQLRARDLVRVVGKVRRKESGRSVVVHVLTERGREALRLAVLLDAVLSYGSRT